MKHLIFTSLLMAIATLATSSCDSEQMEKLLDPLIEAPGSTIERQVKGHEQIYSVQAILRLAQKRSDGRSYAAYGISQFVDPPVPIYQQIDLAKDDMGRITITSQRKAFDVVQSKRFVYALELRYYDLNGKLINHQFSSYDKKNLDESTLLHHQHFFTLQNYSLTGQQLVYPMSLDSLYYDQFAFQTDNQGNRIASTEISLNNIYARIDEKAAVKYDAKLAQRAIEKSGKKDARETYTDATTGQSYKMFKALNPTQMDNLTQEIYTYTYRDTDPVEEELFKRVKGLDDIGRDRFNKPTQLLQQNRDLSSESRPDHLGFKGILQFRRCDVAFQMRVCIAHMLTATEKYISPNGRRGILHEHDQISPSWNSYDIDYPLAFRIIANADENSSVFLQQVRRFYPNANENDLRNMFGADEDWFRHIPQVTM